MNDRYRAAATMYLVYGIVYWLGGFYLWLHGVGRGSTESVVWIALGAALVVLVPFLLLRRRPWFERWILSRRDFARLIAIFLVLRIVAVLRVVVREDAAVVATPWGGEISYRVAGAVFVLVAAGAAFLLARAAWAAEPAP
ncbi:MAG TPA: hypothetical protein VGL09_19880 [Methylomirabilota bacterium]